MHGSHEDPTWLSQNVVWECDSSDGSSEWLDMPLGEPLTFAEYQFASYTPTGADAACPAAPPLPIAVAFPTGVSIERLKEMQQQSLGMKKGKWKKGRRTVVLTVLLLLALIFASLLATLFILLSPLKATPTPTAFNISLYDPLEKQLWEAIGNFSNMQDIAKPHSPQRQAWDFLLAEIQNDTSGQLAIDTDRMRQRFAVSTLFYLAPTDTWLHQAKLHEHECLWSMDQGQRGGVSCTTDGHVTLVNLSE